MCKSIKDKTSCDRHLYVHAATLVCILFSDSCLLLPPALQELQLLRGKKEEAAEEVHMLNCPHPHRRGGHPEGEGDFSREGCGGLEAFVHNFDDLEITTGSQLRSLWYDANHDRSFHLPVGKDLSRQRRRSWSWIISNLEQEVRRCQGLLEEVDSELNDMIRVTRRGYTFHEAGVPPPPPQNQVSVF